MLQAPDWATGYHGLLPQIHPVFQLGWTFPSPKCICESFQPLAICLCCPFGSAPGVDSSEKLSFAKLERTLCLGGQGTLG